MSGDVAGGAAAGAQAGAAFGPWGAAIGGVLGAAGGMGGSSPAGPSQASSLGEIGGAMFDHSGWNVTFGDDSGIEATRKEMGQFSEYLPYVVVGAVFLIGWRWLKNKK